MRILAVNSADSAAIVATPVMVASLPVTNLQNQYRERVARATRCDAQLIELTWGQPTAFSMACLYRNNLSNTAQWRVQIYTDTSMSTLLYDSGLVLAANPKPLGDLVWGLDPLGATLYTDWPYNVSTLWYSLVIGQYMRVTINDPASADGYIQASRLFVGSYFEPQFVGPEPGATMSLKESTITVRTEGGTRRAEPGSSYRVASVRLGLMEATDRARLFDILQRVGLRKDTFMSIFPAQGNALERDHQMQCNLQTLDPATITNFFRYEQTLNFEET